MPTEHGLWTYTSAYAWKRPFAYRKTPNWPGVKLRGCAKPGTGTCTIGANNRTRSAALSHQLLLPFSAPQRSKSRGASLNAAK